MTLALGICPGCGKKGALVPPEALAPAPISNLSLAQKGERFRVSWSVPGKQEGGGKLQDLAGFLLFRRVVLPPAEDCEECPTAYRELARIDLDYPRGAVQIGNRLIYDDSDLERGRSYQYKVRSYTSGGAQSRDSNKVRHRALIPPAPPAVKAESGASSIVLSIVAPKPEEGSLAGFNIYRSKSGEGTPSSPLNATPVTGESYEDKDVNLGVHYSYLVTAVATLNGETVESMPSYRVDGALTEPD